MRPHMDPLAASPQHLSLSGENPKTVPSLQLASPALGRQAPPKPFITLKSPHKAVWAASDKKAKAVIRDCTLCNPNRLVDRAAQSTESNVFTRYLSAAPVPSHRTVLWPCTEPCTLGRRPGHAQSLRTSLVKRGKRLTESQLEPVPEPLAPSRAILQCYGRLSSGLQTSQCTRPRWHVPEVWLCVGIGVCMAI